MCLADALKSLRAEGYRVNGHNIQYAVKCGHIERPRMNGSNQFDFSDGDLDRIRAYLSARRKKRKTAATT